MQNEELEVDTRVFVRRKKGLKRLNPSDVIFVVINTLILSFAVAVTLYPILNTLAVSFNDGLDALRGGIYLLPRKLSFKNYETVFNMNNLLTGARNSVLRTVIASVLHLSVTALLAYVLSVKEFVFRKHVSLFYVLTMYVNAGLIPIFLLFRELGLTNTFAVYIIPGMVAAFNLLVLRTYMSSLPDSLRESAQIDGANHLTIFWKIYAPICKPVFATIALFIAVFHWSSWFDNMIYNPRNRELTTLQYELMKLLSSVTSQTSSGSAYGKSTQSVAITPTSIRAAATIVTSMPIVVLYPFLQRYFITGLTIGGVKE
ncbi:MAG: carbohydrate ABC transporter permease [Clostridiales bacterium]|nr:carbohydrate ABC transporter permease [Clostridiales bacterium]